MFPQKLYPRIASDEFRNAFPSLYNFDYFDNSFVATLRILLHDRLTLDESVSCAYNNTSYSASTFNGMEDTRVIAAYANSSINHEGPRFIKIHSLGGRVDNKRSFEIIDNSWDAEGSVLKGYTKLTDIEKYLETKGIKARFFINEEYQKTAIIMEEIDERKWHFIQSLLPRYMPWFFKDKPLQQDELLLLKSLTSKSSKEYEDLVSQFEKKIDLNALVIRSKLKDFETAFERSRLYSCNNEIESVKRNIRDLENRFAAYHRTLSDLIIKKTGLNEKINNASGESEVMEYFLSSKVLELKDVRGTNISFYVKGDIDNFDIDIFDSYVGNRRCYLYRDRPDDSLFTDDDEELFLRAVFEDNEFKIQVVAGFEMDFGEGAYTAYSHYNYPEHLFKNRIANPHLNEFSCQGNNAMIIRESITNSDYIGAIEACIAMAKNFNFADSSPGLYFVSWLFKKSAKACVRMPDGEMKTPYEALTWLKMKRGIA